MVTGGAAGLVVRGIAAGLAGGWMAGLCGAGGGFILLPLLRLVLGIRQREAQGLTLAALVFPLGLPAMIHYLREGVAAPWRLALVLALGFLPGVWGGAVAASWLPEGPLQGIFGICMVAAALWTALGSGRKDSGDGGARPRLWKGAAAGAAGGFFSGLLGIGGGVVLVPILLLWLRLPLLQATFLSLCAMVAPIRFPGLLVYLRHEPVFPWGVLWGLVAGFAAGTYLGARCALGLPRACLRRALAGIMLVAAGTVLWKA